MQIINNEKINTLRFIKSCVKSLVADKPKFPFSNGVLIKRPIKEIGIKDGIPVITINDDIGIVINYKNSTWLRKSWVNYKLQVKLDNRSYRETLIPNLFGLMIYSPNEKRYYPISHTCYRFLTNKDIYGVFEFRVTKRGFAMLHDDIKQNRNYIATLRRSRYGASFLDSLELKGYTIKKTNQNDKRKNYFYRQRRFN